LSDIFGFSLANGVEIVSLDRWNLPHSMFLWTLTVSQGSRVMQLAT
jgi:hypothetical protein